MKLIIAIVNNDDSHFVNTGLTSSGFHVTKISSTGGFLMNGNSTFLMGIEDDKVDTALEVIRSHSHKRMQNVPTTIPGATEASISVGGATVFVIDIEKALRF